MPITYPHRHNLSTSSQPIHIVITYPRGIPAVWGKAVLRNLLAKGADCWRGRVFRRARLARYSWWKRALRLNQYGSRGPATMPPVRSCALRRKPRAYSEARARQEKSCGAGLINRRVNRRNSRQPGQPLVRSVTHPISDRSARRRHAVATLGSLSGRSRCCRYCCRCCRSGCPSRPSASRSSSCRPSNPRRARRTGPGRRAGCPRLPRR